MISIDAIVNLCVGLERPVLEHWIDEDWVRPDRLADGYSFQEIDVARVHLILELRDQMDVNDAALPIVLSLLDQLYDLRRQMRALGQALVSVAPVDVQLSVASEFARGTQN